MSLTSLDQGGLQELSSFSPRDTENSACDGRRNAGGGSIDAGTDGGPKMRVSVRDLEACAGMAGLVRTQAADPVTQRDDETEVKEMVRRQTGPCLLGT